MPVTSALTVEDPVDAYELFAAGRRVVGLPLDGRWHLRDLGAVHLLQTLPDQGVVALVSVRFPTFVGTLLPVDAGSAEPAGYLQLAFDTDGTDREQQRHTHRDLTRRAGAWLTGRRLRWSWCYEDQPWTTGYLGPSGVRRV